MPDSAIPLIDNNQFGNIPGYDHPASPQAQASGGVPGNGSESFNNVLAELAAKANAPLPSPYTSSSSVAEPHIKPVDQYQPADDHRQPMTNQATSVKLARQQNNFASLGNFIGKAGQAIQEKKQQGLKEDLSTVMKAKQNVHNAEAVLQQDPKNEMAKKVLEANKKALETILSDPKKQKQLAKAMDISFTDPEKNKTPEVQAAQAAMKEHKAAGPFNSDNPQEHQVAVMAANGGKAPEQQSATPRADKALSKDLPEITANPAYAAAMADRKTAETQMTKALPAIIKGEYDAQIQKAKAGDAAALQYYKDQAATVRASMKMINDLKIANVHATAQLKAEAMRASVQIRVTNMRVDALLKISNDRNATEKMKMDIKTAATEMYDKQLNQIATTNKTLMDRRKEIELTPDKQMSGPQKQEQMSLIDAAIKLNDTHSSTLMQERAKRFGEANGPATTIQNQAGVGSENSGASFAGVPLGIPGIVPGAGLLTGSGGSSKGEKTSGQPTQVGAGESDEAELDDDDEANYP